jgi:hypothetical protein
LELRLNGVGCFVLPVVGVLIEMDWEGDGMRYDELSKDGPEMNLERINMIEDINLNPPNASIRI